MEWIQWERKGQMVDNDEGYHYKFCAACCGQAEHDFNGCVDCDNRRVVRETRRKAHYDKDWREKNAKYVPVDLIINRETFPTGDGNGRYTVIGRRSGEKTCDCKGYQYRKQCKHLQLVAF